MAAKFPQPSNKPLSQAPFNINWIWVEEKSRKGEIVAGGGGEDSQKQPLQMCLQLLRNKRYKTA